jgi:hypothetical protein
MKNIVQPTILEPTLTEIESKIAALGHAVAEVAQVARELRARNDEAAQQAANIAQAQFALATADAMKVALEIEVEALSRQKESWQQFIAAELADKDAGA